MSVKSNSICLFSHHVVHFERHSVLLQVDGKQSDTDIEGTRFHTMECRRNFSSSRSRQWRRYDQYKLPQVRMHVDLLILSTSAQYTRQVQPNKNMCRRIHEPYSRLSGENTDRVILKSKRRIRFEFLVAPKPDLKLLFIKIKPFSLMRS